MADVVFNEIDKFYDNGFHAVQELSLDIRDGEFLVLSARPAAARPPRCEWSRDWRTSRAESS